MTRMKLQRESKVFHIPFRIPSLSSLSKSPNFIETDLSQTFCEMVLEEEKTSCTNDENIGKIICMKYWVFHRLQYFDLNNQRNLELLFILWYFELRRRWAIRRCINDRCCGKYQRFTTNVESKNRSKEFVQKVKKKNKMWFRWWKLWKCIFSIGVELSSYNSFHQQIEI